jgi:hypothetical protein
MTPEKFISKDLNEGYNFGSDLVVIRGQSEEL